MKYIKSITFGIAMIGAFLLYMGFNVNRHNIELFIIGTIITAIGIIPFILLSKKEDTNKNKLYENWRNELIINGLKIIVDLSKVTIKANSYKYEIQRTQGKYDGLDELAGIDRRKIVDINECVIEYDTQVNGKTVKFISDIIYKDKITIQFLLMNEKITKLYVDKSNYKNYYFDLDFLQ